MTDDEQRQSFPGTWRLYTDDARVVRKIRIEKAARQLRIAKNPVAMPIGENRSKLASRKRKVKIRHARLKHAKNVARNFLKKARGRRVLHPKEAGLTFRYRQSAILDHINPNREERFETSVLQRKRRRGNATIELKNMSFTHNPKETMNRLGSLVDAECEALGINVDFHDAYCLDVGPYLLLSVIKRAMPEMFLGGEISSPMSKVMKALELDQELGIWVPTVESQFSDVFPFPVHRRRPSGSSTSKTRYTDQTQAHERVAGNLQSAIDNWLGITANQKLNARGRRNVLRLVTETLDNAERHGDLFVNEDDADWIVAGFMARRQADNHDYYRCHLAFLSTGTTIGETIATTPEPTQTRMSEYVQRHRRIVGTRNHSEEHLRTVFALQDGVTRSEIATREKRNGTGIQDILEFYSDLAAGGAEQANASLAIISGKTCVLCNSPYMHGVRQDGEMSERELWFNEPNQPGVPPDAKNIIELDRCLKGTLISMAFTLDVDYLERTVDRAN